MMTTKQGENIMNTFYTWNTKKNTSGSFLYIIKKVTSTEEIQEDGTYTIDTIEKTGTCKTRATAKRKAIQWIKYFRATK